jgi:23S rRNA pseudouridine1911/1915/1917 synthase
MSFHSFRVRTSEKGQTLAAVVKRELNISWAQARQKIAERKVRLNGVACTDAVRRLQPGMVVDVVPDRSASKRPNPLRPPAEIAPKISAVASPPAPSLVFLDDQIVVVEKPAGLTTMRHPEEAAEFGSHARKYLPRTVADMLPKLIGDPKPVLAVHRLDRDTSGLVVFARTKEAEKNLGKQFRAHTIARKYLAIVRGKAELGRIESWLVRDRGDGRRGSTTEAGTGQKAITHVQVVEELGEFTLVECRLETGRTHQVRIHLGEKGTPICGETTYDRTLHGSPVPDESGAERLALHAAILGLHHPETGEWQEWQSALPEDLQGLLQRLRKRK